MSTRVGIGYDSHRFAEGRRLVLGGVEIEHDLGLEGHSDADVVAHAITDAVLGAAGLGDLGTHFPPDDDRWRDADSLDLLRTAVAMVRGHAVNVDATVSLRDAAPGRAPAGDGAPARRGAGRRLSASRRPPTRAWAGSAAARASPCIAVALLEFD